MRQFLFLLLFYSIFLSPQSVAAQASQEAPVYLWFDQVVGNSNTGIYNAVEYVERHRTINEHHKFFLFEGFLPGTVVYEDQPYFDLEVKYNVFDGLLQVRVPNRGNEALFQLLTEKVERFTIAGHEFVNISEKGGFHEILLDNKNMTLLVRYNKSLKKIQDKEFVYYEFLNEDKDYLLDFKGQYYVITSRRDIIDLFPDKKKRIRDFYRDEKSLRKSDYNSFLQKMFQYLSQE